MKILVTGGAGYIGSHTAKQLSERGHDVTVFDLRQPGRINKISQVRYIKGDIRDCQQLFEAVKNNPVDAIMHFAAFIKVEESESNPGIYFQNNVAGSYNLLDACVEFGINKFIFSSSAAVYGNPTPDKIPVEEDLELKPINTYGLTKKKIEEALSSYGRAHDLQSVALRYFNASGADSSGDFGPLERPGSHLIPRVIETAMGNLESVPVFGTDYDTPDGTAVRDYVHVNDLADAHIKALEYLEKGGGPSGVFNLGSGNGYSVNEVIETVKKIVNSDIRVIKEGRRAGDPAILVASSEKAKKALGWEPREGLESIVKSAYNFLNKTQATS